MNRRPSTGRSWMAALGALIVLASLWATVAIAPVEAADPTKSGPFLHEQGADGSGGPTTLVPSALAPTGFQDTTVLNGLTDPVSMRFSPDGRIFVAEKSGLVKVFASLTNTTPTVFADLRGQVDDYWDRGLLGMTLDPNFPTSPYVYVLYALDGTDGGTVPRWNDACPTPPGPTTDGCVITGRLSRLTASGNVATGPEKILIKDWCQQFPSHSLGDLRFGADGALYVSAGDGASFTNVDYGQFGGTTGVTPKNPCGDPPSGVGGTQTAPTARGGSLRSQSLRRPAGDPVVLNGAILRVDPATGAGLPTNPMGGSSDLNARRIVGMGARNPFRFTIRPTTNEIWVGDVGWNDVEEIDRIADPTNSPVANLGWPCFEGNSQQSAFAAAGLDACASLYQNPTGLLQPYFSYAHSAKIVPGEACPTGSSAIAGLAFYQGGPYPNAYDGALFFADHTRGCIWAMHKGSNGLPDPSQVETFIAGAASPVDLETGPNGDLFYVDFDGGTIHRVVYGGTNLPPTAVIKATPPTGPSPLIVALDGTDSTDPEGRALSYSWDLDNNGTFGDSTSATPTVTFTTSGTHTVRLRVTDPSLATDTASFDVLVDDSLPHPVIDTPAASLTWRVGQTISFSGHATDGQGAAIPASGLSWTLILHHCPSNCHTHTVQSFAGVASGSFAAPDHDYPAYLELVLTAKDSSNRTSTVSVRLDPKTVDLTFRTVPVGLALAIGTSPETVTPFVQTVIQNSSLVLTALTPQTIGSASYAFASWSDGLAVAHTILAPTAATTYTATFAAAGGTTAYLSDLPYTVSANGWGPVEKDRSNGEQAAGDGLPLTLAGVVYPKGLGTHAASDIRYSMTGCTTFAAKVGVDDEVGNQGTVVFQVFADGTKVYDSGVLGGASPTATVSVDVTGKTALQLVVTNGGDNVDYDHADWADAKLTCGAGTPPPGLSFAAPVSLPAGTHTHGVKMVDLNGDGKLDLVAANAGSNTASVWLGNGDATFGARSDVATGLAPKMIAVGDLNGDGKPDLVSANQDASTVSVLLGNGAGGFAAKVDYGTCSNTHEAALGDFNGDGNLDVITACWGGSVVSVLLGNGDGTLRAKVDYATGAAPHSVVVGRFDGDAFLDAAVANHDGNTVSVLRGNGDGTFKPQVSYAVGTGPHSLRSGDLNGDGRLDLVSANEFSNDVSVLLGNGDGTFAASVNYATGSVPKGVAIADVSGDGKPDVLTANTAGNYPVCCNPGGNQLSVLLGSGTGTLGSATSFTVGLTPFSIATGDLDGDGDLDVATADWDSGDVTVLRNTTAAGTPPDTTPPNVSGTTPANGATGQSVSVAPTATFSEALDASSVTTSTVTLVKQGTTTVLGATVTYNAATFKATLTPTAALTASTTYVARLKGGTGGIKDVAGNLLAADVTWTFTTAAAGGTTAYLSDLPYTVSANGWGPVEKDRSNGEQAAGDGLPLTLAGVVYPKGLGTHAASDIRYSMTGCTTFAAKVGVDDEVGNQGTVVFQVFADGTKVYDSGVLGGASPTATVSVDVTGKTALQLVVTNGGDNVDYDHADWADAKLTCGAGTPPDTTPPNVSGTTPANGATGQSVSVAPTATFSEALDASSVTTSTVTLVKQGTTTVLGATVTYNAATFKATLTPTAALTASTTYVARLKGGTGGIKDVAGNLLAADVTWTFTTAAGTPPDTTPPNVSGTTPANGATGQSVSVAPTATFSEALDASSVTTSTVTLVKQGTTTVLGATVTYNAATFKATLTPTAALTASTTYVARLKGGTGGIKDVAGNLLAADVTWTFTTAAAGGTTAYLSDLPYTVSANGWGPVEKDRSNGEQAAGDGLPLTLAGVVYPKGLGTHAASDIRYSMTGCTTFAAKVGVDDEVGNQGTVVFQVFADGTKVYDSGVLGGASPTATVSVDVTGKTALQLVVTNGGDNVDYDHADWADAKLTCGAGTPPDTTPPNVSGTTPANGATGQSVSVAPTATFSEALDASSVTTSTVTLVKQGTTTVLGATVTYNAATFKATLTPTAALTASTTYVARLKGGTGGIKDVAGNLLAADVTWTFTTAAAGGTTAYLSDLPYTVSANGWGPVEKDRSNGEQAAGDGLPLTLAGVVYPKGLGTHAASDIRYSMTGCTTFAAKVGVDDEVGNQGTVVFQVFADGTKVYDSGVLGGASPTATVSVDVTGKTALQLVVTNGGDNVDYDHADWADAKLTCG